MYACFVSFIFFFNDTATTEIYTLTHSFPTRRSSDLGGARGGGNALDGLVRAFIGAGGRSVIASHWPAPDDFDATKRLIGGLFAAREGESVADALWTTQQQLMDDKATSHPYYWAGFAIVGDGAQALLRSEGHTSELQSLMRISYAAVCLKNKKLIDVT